MSGSRAIGNALELYETPSKRLILGLRMSCAMARAVPIGEVRELSSFFTEKIGGYRSANSGHSLDFGRKSRFTFSEKIAPVLLCQRFWARNGRPTQDLVSISAENRVEHFWKQMHPSCDATEILIVERSANSELCLPFHRKSR